MQKQLFAIAFLSLVIFLTCANLIAAQVERPGPCPNVQVLESFDTKKYQGKWVLYEGYTGVLSPNIRCLHATYGYNSPQEVSMQYDWIEPNGNANGTRGTGSTTVPGRILVNVSFWAFGSRFDDYVLDTDYTTYATIFTCDVTNHGTHVMLLNTLTRSYNPSAAALAKSKSVMVANGLDITQVTPKNFSNCPPL